MKLPNGTFAVTNLINGVDIFNFPPTQLLQTYTHPIGKNAQVDLVVLCNGELLVVGSDEGKPRILNRLSGNGFDSVLPHGTGLVQALDVRTVH